ncbi:MAG: TolC family outer membrane protein [Litorimonas sp.]
MVRKTNSYRETSQYRRAKLTCGPFILAAMLSVVPMNVAAQDVSGEDVSGQDVSGQDISRTSIKTQPNFRSETLRDTLISTYNKNPRLQAERARLREVDETYIQARAQGRLTSQIDGEFRRELIRTPNVTGGADNPAAILLGGGTIDGAPYQAQLSVIQPIYQGGRIRALKQQAKSDILAARENLRGTENTIFLEAANAYVDVLRDEEVAKIRRNNVRVLTRQLEAAKTRFEGGAATLTDTAQSEGRLAQSELGLAQADAQLQISRANYSRVVGRIPVGLGPAPQFKRPVDLTMATKLALENNPQIIAAYFNEEAARAGIDVAKSAGRINVSLNGTVGGNRNQTIGVPRADQASLAAQITVPIFSGGLNKSRIRQAKHAKARLAFETRDMQWEIERNVAQVWAQLDAANVAVEASLRQEASASVAFKGVELEQSVGTRTQLDVLDAEQEVLDAKLAVVNAQRDLNAANFQLMAVMGVFDSQGLGLAVDNYDPSENFEGVSYKGLKAFTNTVTPDVVEAAGGETTRVLRQGVRATQTGLLTGLETVTGKTSTEKTSIDEGVSTIDVNDIDTEPVQPASSPPQQIAD